jgi:hypothetical protein
MIVTIKPGLVVLSGSEELTCLLEKCLAALRESEKTILICDFLLVGQRENWPAANKPQLSCLDLLCAPAVSKMKNLRIAKQVPHPSQFVPHCIVSFFL